MRILVVTPYLPWPLSSGGNAAQFSTLKGLAADHRYTLVCPLISLKQEEDAQQLARELPNVRIRAVRCWDEPIAAKPLRSGMGVRGIRAALRIARRICYGKSVVPQDPSSSPAPVELYEPFKLLRQQLIDVVSEELAKGVDLCQLEFAEMLSLGPWLPTGIPKLFIHHQLHFVYSERFTKGRKSLGYVNYATEFMRCKELAYLRTFDSIVTFSDDDRKLLDAESSLPPVFTSPFPVPVDVGFAECSAPEFSGSFCFVGSEDHYPNCDGLEWLLDEIWPIIAKTLPKARLLIIGKWSNRWKEKAQSHGEQIVVTGFVKDLGEAIFGGIMLVPLRIGSGIRTKILASLAQGVPCIATTVAAEGLPFSETGGVVIADDSNTVARQAIRLAGDSKEWIRHAEAGLEAVRSEYSPDAVRQRRNEIYAATVTGHRDSSRLSHHF